MERKWVKENNEPALVLSVFTAFVLVSFSCAKHGSQTRIGFDDCDGSKNRFVEQPPQTTAPHLRQWCWKKISFRHLLIREIALPSSGCYWVANQCPQMARYIFSMVAYLQQWKFAQQHKIRHSNYKILPKTLLTPLRIAKDLILAAKVAKFHQIWSHCRHCSWTIPQRTVTVFQPL